VARRAAALAAIINLRIEFLRLDGRPLMGHAGSDLVWVGAAPSDGSTQNRRCGSVKSAMLARLVADEAEQAG